MREFWVFSPCPPVGGQALRGLVHRSEDTVAHSGDTCEAENVVIGPVGRSADKISVDPERLTPSR